MQQAFAKFFSWGRTREPVPYRKPLDLKHPTPDGVQSRSSHHGRQHAELNDR